MATYQYFLKNLLTGATVGELELYGVYATRKINESGTFQGTFRLADGYAVRNADWLANTAPGLRGLVMQRNGVDIWGGILWSRSYAAESRTMQVYGNTWESYFEHVTFWKDHFIQQKVLQETIFSTIVSQLQGQSAESNIGLTIPSLPTTTVKRTVLIPNYEYHFGIEAINQVVNVDLGLEYTINPNKQIIVAAEGNLGASAAAMAYDFPGGDVVTYWMPESGASGAVKLATLGAGSGNKVLRAESIDKDAIAAGYPDWWKVTQYSSIADLSTIQAKNSADFQTFSIPYLTPTFDLRIPETWSAWNDLGASFTVTVQDIRYPTGKTFKSRMMGWEFTPAGKDNAELLKIAVDGSVITA